MITIKRATVDDLSLLQHHCIECYSQNFASHWEEDGLQLYLDACFAEEQLKSDLLNPHIHYYLAQKDNGVAGFMKIIENSHLADTAYTKAVELEKIYIYPAFKGAGIGYQLMNRLFEVAQQTGAGMIWLKVIEQNTAAQQFYSKQGFEYYKKAWIDAPKFKEALRDMWVMIKKL